MKKTLALSAVLALGIISAACPGDATNTNTNNSNTNKPAVNNAAPSTPASTPMSNMSPATNMSPAGNSNMNTKPMTNDNKMMNDNTKPMNKNS